MNPNCENCYYFKRNFPFAINKDEYHTNFDWCVIRFKYIIIEGKRVFVLKGYEKVKKLIHKSQKTLDIEITNPNPIIDGWEMYYKKLPLKECDEFLTKEEGFFLFINNLNWINKRLKMT